jgi:hypothetical protein
MRLLIGRSRSVGGSVGPAPRPKWKEQQQADTDGSECETYT